MALSKMLPKNRIPRDAAATTAAPAEGTTASETSTPGVTGVTGVTPLEDDALRLDGLYNSASNLEVEFETLIRRGTAALAAGQVGAFNSILKLARQLIPNSVALRDDVDEIDMATRPADAHQALHVTIVPTIHNALPEPLYTRHG
jgi:hypothetical protein